MNYDYNDYELIYLIKEESEEAVDLMIRKYDPIIKKMASYYIYNFDRIKCDLDDLVQEGRLGLIQAIRSFDTYKNAIFYTFAILCIKGRILNYLRFQKSNKNYSLVSSAYLDDGYLDNYVGSKMFVEDEYELSCFEEKLILFKNSLCFLDASIFELKFNSFSYKEISILLDIDFKKVDNRLLVIRKKFKKYLLSY